MLQKDDDLKPKVLYDKCVGEGSRLGKHSLVDGRLGQVPRE